MLRAADAVAEPGWAVGQSYKYEWRGTQQITIKETTDQVNQIDLIANVEVDVLSACKRQLRVRFELEPRPVPLLTYELVSETCNRYE